MHRRRYISLITGGVAFISGCSIINPPKESRQASSDVKIENAICRNKDEYTRIKQHKQEKIKIQGRIYNVPKGYGISSAITTEVDGESAICEIRASKQWSPPSVECSGSVNYSVSIEYTGINITELFIVHTVDNEQTLGRTIKTNTD
ncbi:hypothetical protein [Halostella sp. PRR32]|uniref:hypothetical protein n=1 Tax=Halostella sp. PRR32 TaxID=3098147 RepID=UPI002B1DF810|nr:hypothetical protein [Halostella sp. PRR32]